LDSRGWALPAFAELESRAPPSRHLLGLHQSPFWCARSPGRPALPFESSPNRRMSAKRRLLQDYEAGALQMPHNALGGYRGHVLIGLVEVFPALEARGPLRGRGHTHINEVSINEISFQPPQTRKVMIVRTKRFG
jgi:hypothetical protein